LASGPAFTSSKSGRSKPGDRSSTGAQLRRSGRKNKPRSTAYYTQPNSATTAGFSVSAANNQQGSAAPAAELEISADAIQEEIDLLLIAWNYADKKMQQEIAVEIELLKLSKEYATI
jgi:hypothetical protein